MKRLLASPLPQKDRPTELATDEAHHAMAVYRLQNGDTVELLDGEGRAIVARLKIQGKKLFAVFEKEIPVHPLQKNPLPITLAMGILKGEAMEWVIEKAVELGVQKLIPLLTERTVVDLQKKGAPFFVERWQKIADQALKQCGRLTRLRLDEPRGLSQAALNLNAKTLPLWCDEKAALAEDLFLPLVLNQLPAPSSVTLFLGPEGGWSDEERRFFAAQNWQRVSLGPLVLRAETAAIFSVSCLSAYFLKTIEKHGP